MIFVSNLLPCSDCTNRSSLFTISEEPWQGFISKEERSHTGPKCLFPPQLNETPTAGTLLEVCTDCNASCLNLDCWSCKSLPVVASYVRGFKKTADGGKCCTEGPQLCSTANGTSKYFRHLQTHFWSLTVWVWPVWFEYLFISFRDVACRKDIARFSPILQHVTPNYLIYSNSISISFYIYHKILQHVMYLMFLISMIFYL